MLPAALLGISGIDCEMTGVTKRNESSIFEKGAVASVREFSDSAAVRTLYRSARHSCLLNVLRARDRGKSQAAKAGAKSATALFRLLIR